MGLITKLVNGFKLRKLLKEKAFFDSAGGDDRWNTSIERARFDEPVLIHYKKRLSDGFADIHLRSIHWGKVHRSSILLTFSHDIMTIGDIRVLENNPRNGKYSRGYGSLLMDFALREAERRGVKAVIGDMAGNESGQRERQIKYYTKHGFTISLDNKLQLHL